MKPQHQATQRRTQPKRRKPYSKWAPILAAITTASRHSTSVKAQYEEFCFEPCTLFPGAYTEVVPGTSCGTYNMCAEGEVKSTQLCASSLVFDPVKGYCDFAWSASCPPDPTCPPVPDPTKAPTLTPTLKPTDLPTPMPSSELSDAPVGTPTTSAPTPSPTAGPKPTPRPSKSPVAPVNPLDHYQNKKNLIEKQILVAKTASGISYPSVRYTYDGLMNGLQVAIDGFGGGFKFFLGDSEDGNRNSFAYGAVNLAAFLANAMVSTIYSDSCDENNWQQVAGRYAISNSCGQDGRSYQDETCGEEFSCPVDPNMEMTAVTSGNQVRAPPPMKCEPGSGAGSFSGYWDTSSGSEISIPYSNSLGRTDTEGCCWWGRGALLTRGVCNIGKFNYYVGKGASDRGEPSLYPDIDFCTYPEATCASNDSEELRWTVPFFEWAERVQTYDNSQFNYMDRLAKFVESGTLNDDSFILSVNRILELGCHSSGCSDREVRNEDERKANFYAIIYDVFDVYSLIVPETDTPTFQPTSKPTRSPIKRSISDAPATASYETSPIENIPSTQITPSPQSGGNPPAQTLPFPSTANPPTNNSPSMQTPPPTKAQTLAPAQKEQTNPSPRQPANSSPIAFSPTMGINDEETYYPTYFSSIIDIEGNDAPIRRGFGSSMMLFLASCCVVYLVQ